MTSQIKVLEVILASATESSKNRSCMQSNSGLTKGNCLRGWITILDSSKCREIAVFSFVLDGINMLLASRYVADVQYRVCLMLIALCFFLVAPCHLTPLSRNKYNQLDISIHLGISLLLSAAFAWIKPGIILPAVIVEIPTLVYLIKYQVFQRICRFLERQQKVTAYKKVAEPVGWMHYPTERILEAAYYFLVFLVFGILFYKTAESTFILIAFTILAGACLFLCAVWSASILVFNKEMILRIFAWKCRRYDIKNVKEIRYGRLRWKLRGVACGATLRIAGAMTGDILQMLSLFKKRIVHQHQDS